MKKEIYISEGIGETRIADKENGKLAEIYLDKESRERTVGNIYKGIVENVIPGMQAAFVNIGRGNNAFLPFSEISDSELIADSKNSKEINVLLKQGQEIVVQVTKDPLGTKGARITMHIGITGHYLVYLPTSSDIFISRRIENETERTRLKTILQETENLGGGYIVRTVGQECEKIDFEPDLDFLHRLWERLQKKAEETPPCNILYEDLNLTFRSMRDLVTSDVARIVLDSKLEYQSCLKFCKDYLPHICNNIELYQEPAPIFDHFGIEIEINRALDRKVWLKSGGYILIDQTEALIAIDVNTGKYVGSCDPE